MPLDVLVIAPHPDDAELGAGGAMLHWKREGRRVGVLDLTNGEPTPFGDPEIRARETAAATALLNLDYRGNLGLPNRSLEATLDARARLAGVIRELRPRWLCAPYWVDAHPDHVAATALVEASKTVGFTVPLVVRLEGTEVEEGKKILATSGTAIITADGLTDAAKKVVAASRA